ncbi:MAG: hypothetical protein Q8L19_09565 [Reyranella sp.]|nr:hypothetical protein [Reyranella sp.]
MTMIIAQRPMAVSIVAGRVFKRGVGACAWRSSGMANHSKNCFVKNNGLLPEIMG